MESVNNVKRDHKNNQPTAKITIASEESRYNRSYNSYYTAYRYGRKYLKNGGVILMGKTIYMAFRYYSDCQGMYVSEYTTYEKFAKDHFTNCIENDWSEEDFKNQYS